MMLTLKPTGTLWLLIAISLSPTVIAQQDASSSVPPSISPERTIVRHPDAVPRLECFPVESLDAESMAQSTELLLAALDREPLYTLVGGIKPVSEGFWSSRFRISPPETTEIEKVQKALSVWKCGSVYQADTIVFENLIEGQRHVSAWIANRPALSELIATKKEYFGRLGILPHENPEVVLMSIERSQDREERWRGFGTLFGYPSHAIEFFVRAGKHQSETGEFIERDFRSIPTHENKSGRFVYAVPKIAPLQAEDQVILDRAQPIFDRYSELRKNYIGDGKPGVIELLRDWFDDGSGYCHPSHAMEKLSPSRRP